MKRKQRILIRLNEAQTQLHERALFLSQEHRRVESELIEVLKKIDEAKLFKFLGCSSLFVYAVTVLGLSEAVAYSFITVARKSKTLPKLKEALQSQTVSVSKMSRIVSVMDSQNADELIEFAKTHTSREIDFEVARLNPKVNSREKMRVLSEDQIELRITLSKKALQNLERMAVLETKALSKTELIEKALEFFLEKKDPVLKAERVLKKGERVLKKNEPALKKSAANSVVKTEVNKKLPVKKLCLNRVSTSRKPLSAKEKHEVFLRDQGKCTHVDANGKRCSSEKWVEVHHITPVSYGGTNNPANLTTLCSFHHDLTHQLSLPLEGQVTWLRNPERRYGA